MTKNTWLAIIVILLLAIGGWYYQNNKTIPFLKEPIKLGAIYAVTGPAAKFGEFSINGVKDAAALFKEKTGQEVELIIEDSAGDAKQGVSAANKLLSLDKVKFAIVGTSAISAAVAPVAESAKVFLLSDAALLGLTKDKKYTLQNFMPSLSDIPKQVNANNSWNKVAVVYINDEFGSSWATNIQKGVDSVKTVQTFSFEKTATDYRTQALKIKQFNPDLLVVIGYGPALNQVFSDLTLNGVKVPIISYLNCTLPGVLTDKRFSLEGQYSYEYPPVVNEDMKTWIEKRGGSFNTFYTVAFENTIIALTAAQASNNNPDQAIEYLKNNSFDGLWGGVLFGQDGVVNRELVLTKISNGNCVPTE